MKPADGAAGDADPAGKARHDGADDALLTGLDTTFVRLRRSRTDATAEELVLSRAAMHLHTFGVLSSIDAGNPGFVPDRFLDTIPADTSVTALELCLAGLWERTERGYRVSPSHGCADPQDGRGNRADAA